MKLGAPFYVYISCHSVNRIPRGSLTTRCYVYIIGDNSNKGQDVPSRVEMGNPGKQFVGSMGNPGAE